ncbi:MAG: hypothetical protein QXT64_00095 [Desulfurococcaceae archaeon]
MTTLDDIEAYIDTIRKVAKGDSVTREDMHSIRLGIVKLIEYLKERGVTHPYLTNAENEIMKVGVLKSMDIVSPEKENAIVMSLYWLWRLIEKLAYLQYTDSIILSEPIFFAGKEFFVDYTWSDTTPHFFNYDPNYTSFYVLPSAIELDQPAANHKRSYEYYRTTLCYTFGWYWHSNFTAMNTFKFNMRMGAYHGYDGTRANIALVIGNPGIFDETEQPALPYCLLSWSMYSLGYPNGSYDKSLYGYIVLTDPPILRFTPANPPHVAYRDITSLAGSSVNLLVGYNDAWLADWDQWASLHRLSYFVTGQATHVRYELRREIEIEGYSIRIIRRDGFDELWIKRGREGLLISFNDKVEVVEEIRRGNVTESLNKYDEVFASGREKPIVSDDTVLIIRRMSTGIPLRVVLKFVKKTGRLLVVYGEEGKNMFQISGI